MKSRLKSDLLLFVAIVLVAVAIFAITTAMKSDGKAVVITLNGSTYTEADLSKNVEIDVDGLLTVVIDGGEVYVKDSTCPDGLCERSGAISKSGESIVCLPCGVVVKITADEPEYDFIN
ncbi:MAG: NusG domain II-containing protein [Oscillospiraceae bacterium]|nr:NusG domain II-containing protein [Oscillospiraceae bacterium]